MLDKILWSIGILAISLLFGFAPKLFSKFSKDHHNKTKLLGFSNALSGGIFLSIAFFHLLPEANETFRDYFNEKNKPKLAAYPFHFLFAFLSYSMILFIEKIAFNSHSLIDHKHDEKEIHIHSDNEKANLKANSNSINHSHNNLHGPKNKFKKDSELLLNTNVDDIKYLKPKDLEVNNNDKTSFYINISSNNGIKYKNKNILHSNTDNFLDNGVNYKNDINNAICSNKLNNNKEYLTTSDNTEIKVPLIENSDKLAKVSYINERNFQKPKLHSTQLTPKKCLDKLYDLEEELKREGYVVEHDEEQCSDEEEELVKGIIGKKGQFMAFMQVRNLKSKYINYNKLKKFYYFKSIAALNDNRKYKTAKVKLIADPALLKAGDLLAKTFKKDIVKEDCLDTVKNCSNNLDVNSHDHHEHGFQPSSNITPYILMVALSIHGFFEGIALGLQTRFDMVLYLGLAIISHKWAESFTLGISFYKTNTEDKTYYKLIILFSLFTPLGILFGMLIVNSSDFIEAVFLALSSGTFIYIACSEIIVEEFSVTKYKYTKFFLFLIGAFFIGFMSLLETLNNL